MRQVGEFISYVVGYILLIALAMAMMIIALYLVAWGFSVWQMQRNTTGGVCTSTLCE